MEALAIVAVGNLKQLGVDFVQRRPTWLGSRLVSAGLSVMRFASLMAPLLSA